MGEYMKVFLLHLCYNSIVAAMMILLVLALRPLFSKGSTRIRVWLWLLVMCRLLMPYPVTLFGDTVHPMTGIKKPFSGVMYEITGQMEKSSQRDQQVVTEQDFGDLAEKSSQNSISYQNSIEDQNDNVNQKDYTSDNHYEKNAISIDHSRQKRIAYLFRILAGVWCVGVLLLFGHMAITWRRFKHRLQMAIPEERSCFGNPVKVYRSEALETAFVAGFFKPKIYLPASLPEEQLPYLLSHECLHLRRKDYLWKTVFFVAAVLHWMNPLVWAAYVLMSRDIELACDESVIRDYGKEDRIVYSELLLYYASDKTGGIFPVSFGENGRKRSKGIKKGENKGMKCRVNNIVHYSEKRARSKTRKAAAMAVCLLVSGFLMMNETDTLSISMSKPLTMEILLDWAENGEMERILAENDIDLLEGFSNWQGEIGSYCDVEYQGKSYRIMMKIDSEKNEGQLPEDQNNGITSSKSTKNITYFGMVNEYHDWLRLDRQDKNTLASLKEYLNRSYEMDDYFDVKLPDGMEIMPFDGEINTGQKGWLFKGRHSEAPLSRELAEMIRHMGEETRYCDGGIGLVEKEEFIYREGKLTDIDWQDNHMVRSTAEVVEGLPFDSVLVECQFDLFSQSVWKDYCLKHQEAEEEQNHTAYWYLFMNSSERDYGYVLFLNQAYYTKEELLSMAKTIRVENWIS